MANGTSEVRSDSKHLETQAQKSVLKGCALIVLVALGLLIGAFMLGSKIAGDWAAAKPMGMSDSAWSQKRELCERINLEASECAARPDNEVRTLSNASLKRELEKVCADDNPSAAIDEAQRIVRVGLKAPASADFVSGSARTTHDGCFWAVSGEVDAQNSFGAQLRSNYYVTLRRAGKDLWLPLKVRVQ